MDIAALKAAIDGIRIEDNVVLHANGVENLTRQAGL